MGMFEGEWDQDTALEVRWEEGLEEGLERGMEEGLEKGMERGLERGMEERDRYLLALIEQGYTVEDLKRELSARV